MSQEKERLGRDYLRKEQILKLLGISEGTLGRLISEKEFPYIKIGQEKLFYDQDVILWMKLQKHGFDPESKKEEYFLEK